MNDFNPVKYTGVIIVVGWAFIALGATLLITTAVLHLRSRKEHQ